MMKFTIKPPLRANIEAIRRASLKQFGAAAALAADQTAKAAQTKIRDDMRRGKLGNLANAIGQSSDLKKRRVPDPTTTRRWRAGATVFARGNSERTDGAIAAYSNGNVTITPRRGRWLAIATDELAKRVPGIKGGGRKGARKGSYRMTPALYDKRGLDRKIGELEFIPGKNPNEALLIVRDVQVNAARGFGQARRLPKSGKARAGKKAVGFIVAFVLIRVTRRSQRFDPKAAWRQEFGKMPGRIRANLRGKVAAKWNGRPVAAWTGSSLSFGTTRVGYSSSFKK